MNRVVKGQSRDLELSHHITPPELIGKASTELFFLEIWMNCQVYRPFDRQLDEVAQKSQEYSAKVILLG